MNALLVVLVCSGVSPVPDGGVPYAFAGTPLHWAATNGLLSATTDLLRSGANANALDQLGRTPLLIAMGAGHREVARVLIQSGADVRPVDPEGHDALFFASAYGWLDIVGLTLHRGAAVNRVVRGSPTALHAAARTRNGEVVRLLLAHGAKPNAIDLRGFTPLFDACIALNAEVVRLLLAAGADPNAIASPGKLLFDDDERERGDQVTPLMVAAASGDRQIIEVLLASGAKGAARSSTGATAASIARSHGHHHLLPLLDPSQSAIADTLDPIRSYRRRLLASLTQLRRSQPQLARGTILAAMAELPPSLRNDSGSMAMLKGDTKRLLDAFGAGMLAYELGLESDEPVTSKGLSPPPAACIDTVAALDVVIDNVVDVLRESDNAVGDFDALRPAGDCALRLLDLDRAAAGLAMHLLGMVAGHIGEPQGSALLLGGALRVDVNARGPEAPEVLLDAFDLAHIQAQYGELEGAEKNAEAILKVAMKQGRLADWHGPRDLDGGQLTVLLNLIADGYGKRKRPADRERVLRRQVELGGGDFSRERLASTFAQEGKVEEALALQAHYLEQGEDGLDQLLRSQGNAAARSGVMREYITRRDLLVSLHLRVGQKDPRALRLALTSVLRVQGRTLNVASNTMRSWRQYTDPGSRVALERLDALRRELSGLSTRPSDAAGRQKMASLATEEAALQRALGDVTVREAPPLTVEAVQRGLPEDAVMVIYVGFADAAGAERHQRRYAAFVVPARGSPSSVLLDGEASDLDAQVEELREAMADVSTGARVRTLARTLDDRVFAPVEPLLGGSKHVFLVADGTLNLVPFGALVDSRGVWRLRRFTFTSLSSGRDLLELQRTHTVRAPPMVMGAPDYGAEGGAAPATARGQRSRSLEGMSWSPLTGARAEVAEVAAIWKGASLLRGSEATEGALKKLAGPEILHIATHGFVLPAAQDEADDDPMLRAGLVLAGANRLSSGSDDGILTALEVSGLDLRGTRLVTLSACETGVGSVSTGEGVWGLRRALTVAGAQTQLLSLWRIDDESTRRLMLSFYTRLQAGSSRADALRGAQLELLDGVVSASKGSRGLKAVGPARSPIDPRHPFFWAGFVLSGDDGKMAAEASGHTPPPDALLRAARSGTVAEVTALLDAGADLEALDEETGRTALGWAARRGELKLLSSLLARGAFPGGRDVWGMTPVAWATKLRRPELVHRLMAAGSDTLEPNKLGDTPADFAAFNGERALAKVLEPAGARVAERKDRNFFERLQKAAQRCEADGVELALVHFPAPDEGARWSKLRFGAAGNCDDPQVLGQLLPSKFDLDAVDTSDIHRPTLLTRAAFAGKLENVRMLLKLGADPKRSSGAEVDALSPVGAALRGGHTEVAMVLLKAGAPLPERAGALESPLVFCARRGDLPCLRLLLARGAKADDAEGRKALANAWSEGQAEAAMLLEAAGSRRNPSIELMASITMGDLEKVKENLNTATGVDEPTELMERPLVQAARLGRAEVVELLLSRGAGLESDYDARGPLAVAIDSASKTGDLRCVTLLLRRGDAAVRTQVGDLGLDVAAFQARPQLVHLLLNHGAPSDQDGLDTPLKSALLSDSLASAALLVRAGANPNTAHSMGPSLLEWERSQGHEQRVDVLSRKGKPVRHDVQLLIAAELGDAREVERLLVAGVDANTRSDDGQTPLIKAARQGHAGIVRLLLKGGADPNVRGEGSYEGTALSLARKAGRHDVAKLVVAAGGRE